MNKNNDFFGDVFDDPDDDPLLGDDDDASDGPSSNEPEEQGPPSWMSDEPRTNGEAHHPPNGEQPDPKQKEIVVDQGGDRGHGIDALNQAVGQGWRLVRISMDRPDDEKADTPEAAHRFVAILEQDRPQSLFDFG
jgi:hypothetical protein